MTPVEFKRGIKLVLNTRLLIIALLFPACQSKSSEDTSPKFQQYYVKGEQLYLQNCSNCHQKDGSGLGLLYPPLDSSDFMQNNLEEVVCLIRNGKDGELLVNGKKYNQAMPALGISDLEIAEIATYIYNSWNNRQGLMDVKLVSKILTSCDSLTTQ